MKLLVILKPTMKVREVVKNIFLAVLFVFLSIVVSAQEVTPDAKKETAEMISIIREQEMDEGKIVCAQMKFPGAPPIIRITAPDSSTLLDSQKILACVEKMLTKNYQPFKPRKEVAKIKRYKKEKITCLAYTPLENPKMYVMTFTNKEDINESHIAECLLGVKALEFEEATRMEQKQAPSITTT